MLNITQDFKDQVVEAILQRRANFNDSDAKFAAQIGISAPIFSRLKKGERDKVLSNGEFIRLGREFGIETKASGLKTSRTDTFNQIETDIIFCKEHSKAMIFADDPEIGKTTAAKYLAQTIGNYFYVDCSKARTTQLFIRTLAKTIGLPSDGKYASVKEDIKYYLNMIEKPIVVLDDGGYLDLAVFIDLNELWNGTENRCGWYMLGDEALQKKIQQGITTKKPGVWAFFSRWSSNYSSITPSGNNEKLLFHRKLAEDVLTGNNIPQSRIAKILPKAVTIDGDTNKVACLRRLDSLLLLNP